MSDIEVKVKEIVAKQLGVDLQKIELNSAFIQDLGADSLDQVEMVMAFEEAFNVEIPDEAAEKIVKISDAVEYIEKAKK